MKKLNQSLRVVALARAMCLAVDVDPDEQMLHHKRGENTPQRSWPTFRYQALNWILEFTDGALPKQDEARND